MHFRKIIIAIDGYSACGKSTTACEVSRMLGYRYIDSGAMYRAVTLYFLNHHIALSNPKEVRSALSRINVSFKINSNNETELFLNGLNSEKEIREMRISENVSQVSALKDVRAAMVTQQRKLGKDKGIVMDGRDIGTVVFPEAELKVFMTADIMVRAFRRQQELLERDTLVNLDEILDNIRRRDKLDTTRKESPLRKADDAIEIDTTNITIEEQVEEVLRLSVSRLVQTASSLNIIDR